MICDGNALQTQGVCGTIAGPKEYIALSTIASKVCPSTPRKGAVKVFIALS